jgi:hypothetical protein
MATHSNQQSPKGQGNTQGLLLSAIRVSITGKTEGRLHPRSARKQLEETRSSFLYSPVGSDEVLEILFDSAASETSQGGASTNVEIKTHVHTLTEAGLSNHRLDESSAGYSSAGWSPPEPASASPAGEHLEKEETV